MDESASSIQVDKAFQSYLGRLQAGEQVDQNEFIASQPANLRPRLKRMLADYDELREKFGDFAPKFEPGRILGDYQLVSELGRGGMGVVWEAHQISLERRVALKLLFPHFSLSPKLIDRFSREARAGGRLAHPGLVQVYALGEADGVPFLAQEFVPGGYTLADYLIELRGTEELNEDHYREIATIFVQIADALECAHQAGVIHRDIKPSNILLTESNTPKIADFGLALVEDGLGLSRSGEIVGTPFYMSPEQATSRGLRIDHRTDIFSLGATLYEVLTLLRPFQGDTYQQVLEKIANEDPRNPRELKSRIPADLALICLKSLEKRPDSRYASMKSFSADIRRYLDHEPILAQPPRRIDRARKWIRRHPIVSAGCAATTVVMMAFSALFMEMKAETNRANEALKKVFHFAGGEELRILQDRANELWPCHPDNIQEFKNWLTDAESLVNNLSEYRATIEDIRTRARVWTAEEQARSRANHPKQGVLKNKLRDLTYSKRRLTIRTGGVDTADDPEGLEPIDWNALPQDWSGLHELAESMVNPNRRIFGEEKKGLQIARRALALAPPEGRHLPGVTLGWALFANGLHEEALRAWEEAWENGTPSYKEAFGERELESLRAIVAEQTDPAGLEELRKEIVSLTAEVQALEKEVSVRLDWSFDDRRDSEWHRQLQEVVAEIEAFSHPETGMIDGVHPEFGLGVRRRLDFAKRVLERTVTGAEAGRRWAEAIASISDPNVCPKYGGLQIAPHLGLLPLGQDRLSGFWEFAHVFTGEVPERDQENGQLILTGESGIVLILVPGGSFWMGAQSDDPAKPNFDVEAGPGESPVREVTLSAFFISKYETTQGQWERVMRNNPSDSYGIQIWQFSSGPERRTRWLHPVENVSWLDCELFLSRVALRFPTEAQWEYAARGGTTTPWWTGSERGSLEGAVNLKGLRLVSIGEGEAWVRDGDPEYVPVNQYQPNPFGLYNVQGNVFEWCQDCFDGGAIHRFNAPESLIDPAGPPDGIYRVVRGGFQDTHIMSFRSAVYSGMRPNMNRIEVGFRVALPATQKQ